MWNAVPMILDGQNRRHEMKLSNLLHLITDTSNVKIFSDGLEIAEYNGRDSIPNELNNRLVASIHSGNNYIGIEIV